jgi:hypothetical protein
VNDGPQQDLDALEGSIILGFPGIPRVVLMPNESAEKVLWEATSPEGVKCELRCTADLVVTFHRSDKEASASLSPLRGVVQLNVAGDWTPHDVRVRAWSPDRPEVIVRSESA